MAGHVREVLTHDKLVRQHWHNKVTHLLVGSVDPWHLEDPLTDYGGARRVYAKLYRFFYRSRPAACQLVWNMILLARAGHPLLLVETDAAEKTEDGREKRGAARATRAQLMSAAAATAHGSKMGHSMVLAWDLLHFVEDGRVNGPADIAAVPLTRPDLPIPSLTTGWRARRDAGSLTVGDLAEEALVAAQS